MSLTWVFFIQYLITHACMAYGVLFMNAKQESVSVKIYMVEILKDIYIMKAITFSFICL